MRPYQRNIGMVFQSYALFPHMTAWKNVVFPLRMRRFPRQREAGACRSHARPRRLAAVCRPLSARAIRRPAAARRARARSCIRSRRSPARRAARRARQESARADAARDQAHPSRARHHHDLCHPRPDRGHDHVGSRRGILATENSSRSARRSMSISGRSVASWASSSATAIFSLAGSIRRARCRARRHRPGAVAADAEAVRPATSS